MSTAFNYISLARTRSLISLLITFAIGAVFSSIVAFAWTGPTQTPPNANVAAPVNVGTTDQIKNAGLGVNSLAVYGVAYIETKIGVGRPSPAVALDVNGSARIADGGEECSAGMEGTLRYNTALQCLQYCDGSNWQDVCGPPVEPVTIFLTSGTSWTVPANWNSSNNTIEVIGGGGGGGGGINNDEGGGGGGGGAYSKVENLTLSPGGSVAYSVGTAGSAGAGDGGSGGTGGDTYFCDSTSNCASIGGSAVQVGAKGGSAGSYATPGAGGAAASGVGTTKNSGGSGGTVPGCGGSGGGGAAGPHGAGATGGAAADSCGGGGGGGGANTGSNGSPGSGESGGAGGNGRTGTGGGPAGSPGGNGSNGGGGGGGNNRFAAGHGGQDAIWTQTIDSATAGPGGGGGGGGAGEAEGLGGNAASYGAGGGGAGDEAPQAGTGAQGIIIITYTP